MQEFVKRKTLYTSINLPNTFQNVQSFKEQIQVLSCDVTLGVRFNVWTLFICRLMQVKFLRVAGYLINSCITRSYSKGFFILGWVKGFKLGSLTSQLSWRIYYITFHLLDAFIQSDLHTFSTVGNPHRSNLGWGVLPRDTTTCWLQWDSNLLPPDLNWATASHI